MSICTETLKEACVHPREDWEQVGNMRRKEDAAEMHDVEFGQKQEDADAFFFRYHVIFTWVVYVYMSLPIFLFFIVLSFRVISFPPLVLFMYYYYCFMY